jgi:ubiquinone/menaquinone biosynthesis C-methylase UbiE
MTPDQERALSYESWLKSPMGYYVEMRTRRLILDLLSPQEGETLLDAGCKTGNNLVLFKRAGCTVAGIDTSPSMLDIARKKLGRLADLSRCHSDDLPFSDNEFDIVTVINCLEFARDPQKTIEEAIRVARGRVFVGTLNKFSFFATHRTLEEIFGTSPNTFSVWELKQMVKIVLAETPIRWGSVVFFPWAWYTLAANLEEGIPVRNNPFGSFLGITFPVIYTHMTLQDPLKESLKVGVTRGRQMPGTARESKQ